MIRALGWGILCATVASATLAQHPSTQSNRNALFAHDNLVAWCIVPFDAKKRSPDERAAMLERIGITHYAYDWRNEHLPTFEAELDALKRHHIELTAVWFPAAVNDEAKFLLDALKRHDLKPQLWVMVSGYPLGSDTDTQRNFDAAVKTYAPVADAAQAIGCKIALYNHGGWLGEPENMLELVKRLNRPNVGIVYNLHHGHDHLDRFSQVLKQMLPHLMCLNLNGMTRDGERLGKKIMPIAQGDLDLQLLRAIRDSGYDGHIGILNHTDEDAEARLLDNLDGLDWLVPQLDGTAPSQPKPKPRSYVPATSPAGAVDYWKADDAQARSKLPMYQVIEAARDEELTPANGWPDATQATWSRSHGNDACTRYSRLAQINRDNVKSLKVAWIYHSKDGVGNIQCNPIVHDGVLYAPTVGNCIVAINAEYGRELWRFQCGQWPARRGLTFHAGSNGASDRLLFAAGKALWALDLHGQPIASFGDHGKVPVPECAVAPAVCQNIIVVPGWYGDVFGLDLYTGKPLWTFHTIPRGDEFGADTWDKPQDGANCWGGIALDRSRGITYVTTGSPKPNFIGVGHRGDNLFANCVIAIDVLTGKRLWHFQEVRHDIWDFDIPAPPILVTVNHNGRRVDAVAALTKLGNTLLLDRVTGKPLFPFRLRRAPVSTAIGEQTAAYQPDVELPQPFARQQFTRSDVTNISQKSRRFVFDKIENAKIGWFEPPEPGRPYVTFNIHGGAEWTGGCFDPQTGLIYVSSNELPWIPSIYRSERPAVDETKLPATAGRSVYQQNCLPCHGPSREGVGMSPSLLGVTLRLKDDDITKLIHGGRGIMPAFKQMDDAKMKDLLAYLGDRDRPNVASTTRPERPSYRDIGYPKLLDQDGYPGCTPPWGTLNGIDLNTGKIAWRVPLGEYDELTKSGIPKTGTENFGGPIVTAGGLVFCAGTRDIKIRAFDKSTGEELWSHALPFGGFAPPSTFEVHGKQYIVIPATGGGKLDTPRGDCYVAFSLP
ncbi:MAG TPA: PQQ-binding-like beta-propeller repeat protein, partial [Tepidisphaeraceae bacterium]|nr:PQQ-binding-like beta-propeller repeat protein [Tepidisphaeraceae bacterium]